jgi:hypothetical protein
MNSDLEYESKYLKYKAKYFELLKLYGGTPPKGFHHSYKEQKSIDNRPIIEKVLTINDPYCKGVQSGDVDDCISLLYLAQEFKSNLNILIIDSRLRRATADYNFLETFIKETYGSKFYYDEEFSPAVFDKLEFDTCFICAQLPQNVFDYFKTYKFSDRKFYLQGGYYGYNANYGNTYHKYNEWSNKPIEIESEDTNQSYPISEICPYYKENTMCKNWDLYQVKKIFSVIYGAPFPYGFWFKVSEDDWGGKGNTKDTLNKVIESLGGQKVLDAYKLKFHRKFSQQLIAAYHSYIEKLCNHPARISSTQAVKEQKILKLKQIYDNQIIPLAHLLFDDASSVERTLLAADKTIKPIGNIVKLNIKEGLLKETTKLYDFNMSAFIVDMTNYNKKLKHPKKEEIKRYIDNQRQLKFLNNIKILNKMLYQLKKDFNDFRRKILVDTNLDLNKFKDTFKDQIRHISVAEINLDNIFV